MLAQTDALPGRRVALVIGNGNYAKEGALRNPVNDARDMCAKLKSLQFETLCYLDIQDSPGVRALDPGTNMLAN